MSSLYVDDYLLTDDSKRYGEAGSVFLSLEAKAEAYDPLTAYLFATRRGRTEPRREALVYRILKDPTFMCRRISDPESLPCLTVVRMKDELSLGPRRRWHAPV